MFAHLTSPRLSFADKGKAKLNLPGAVAVEVTEPRQARHQGVDQAEDGGNPRRAGAAEADRSGRPERPSPMTQKDVVWREMERAYMLASANNQYPANKRQIYYAIRDVVEQATDGKLSGQYFSQTLLPDFIKAHPQLTADWDVVADDRGHFAEPHTGKRIGVGTLAVREYIEEIVEPEITEIEIAEVEVVTKGPAGRYGSILYIEKEGFDPIIEAAGIPEEFDIAPMSCKGMSVIAGADAGRGAVRQARSEALHPARFRRHRLHHQEDAAHQRQTLHLQAQGRGASTSGCVSPTSSGSPPKERRSPPRLSISARRARTRSGRGCAAGRRDRRRDRLPHHRRKATPASGSNSTR